MEIKLHKVLLAIDDVPNFMMQRIDAEFSKPKVYFTGSREACVRFIFNEYKQYPDCWTTVDKQDYHYEIITPNGRLCSFILPDLY